MHADEEAATGWDCANAGFDEEVGVRRWDPSGSGLLVSGFDLWDVRDLFIEMCFGEVFICNRSLYFYIIFLEVLQNF